MDYNGNGYFGFIKNLQGDIVSIVPLDSESNVELNIEYDAWGKPIFKQASSPAEAFMTAMIMAATSVAYRGYFYDFDTGLYYLRSRYYDPTVKRFVNGVMYSFYISEKNSLKSINVSKENPYYLSVNRILFRKKPLKVLCIPGVYYLE